MQVGQRLGPFEIDKKLGSGAMGAVYRARYRKTGQRVAIKIMAPGLTDNETALARFEREGEVLKQLNHPNIVRFYAAAQSQGAPYYAMEYIEGEPLDDVLKRRGRLTWEEVVELGKQVCAALRHAHEKGIIHRDLKPSNLMILADGTVKLTDFGIAKDLDVTQLTSANCTVGTAAYMSPEQCRGERNLTYKSDLYSLGVVLYELLTGRKPFQAETTLDMFLQHVQGTFERSSRLVLDIPVWLDTLVCQLLEKKPEQRPCDAETVAQALSQVAEKVAALQSAGVDAVRARKAGRGGPQPDDTDRKAARTLLASMGKGKKKRRRPPFYQRVWFQALGILAVLLAFGWIFYQVFRPPSADLLYAQAEKLIQAGDADSLGNAIDANGPVHQFLTLYPQDPRAREVREWQDQLAAADRERAAYHRRQMGIGEQTQGEKLARRAMDKEDLGELQAARPLWDKLAQYQDETDAETAAAWRQLGKQRLAALDQAAQMEQGLAQEANAARLGQTLQPASELERRAVRAIRLQDFGDGPAALDLWNQLKQETERGSHNDLAWYWKKQPEVPWYLLAAKKMAELADQEPKDKKKEEIKEERRKRIQEKLAEAERLAADGNPRSVMQARALCQDIVDLYQEDPEPALKELVKRARTLLKAPPPSVMPKGIEHTRSRTRSSQALACLLP